MSTHITMYFWFVFVFVVAISASAQEQAAQPVYKDGDSWQFTINQKDMRVSTSERISGTVELVVSQGQVKVYEVIGDQKNELNIRPGGPGDGLSALVAQNQERPTLKFPLSAGQKWNYEYVTRPAGAQENQKRLVEAAVTGIEQITTPAGSFKVYKVVRKESWLVRKGWVGSTVTYFYSPETRSIVKTQTVSDTGPGSSETELIKFMPAN